MNPLSWEARWSQLRAEVHEAHADAQALEDGSADQGKARFHSGQVNLAARFLARMDELAGERSPQS